MHVCRNHALFANSNSERTGLNVTRGAHNVANANSIVLCVRLTGLLLNLARLAHRIVQWVIMRPKMSKICGTPANDSLPVTLQRVIQHANYPTPMLHGNWTSQGYAKYYAPSYVILSLAWSKILNSDNSLIKWNTRVRYFASLFFLIYRFTVKAISNVISDYWLN